MSRSLLQWHLPPVLLLDDGLLVAVVALVALLCLTMFGIVALLLGRAPRAAESSLSVSPFTVRDPAARSSRIPHPATAPSLRGIEIDVPTKFVDAFAAALRSAGWNVRETGEVVATDDDEEALTTLSVDAPMGGGRAIGSGEEIR